MSTDARIPADLLTDELRRQCAARTRDDEPDLDALLALGRHLPSRRVQVPRFAWAAAGVTVTAAAVGVTLVALDARPSQGSGPGFAAPSPSASASPSPRVSPSVIPDDSAEFAAAQWFRVESQSTQRHRIVWFSHHGVTLLQQADAPGSLGSKAIPVGSRGMVTWDELQSLPRDPKALAKAVRSSGGVNGDDQLFDGARQTLEESPADLSLRQALVKVLEGVARTTTAPWTQDSKGRASFQVSHTDVDGQVFRLDVDPSTFRILEETDYAGPTYPTAVPAQVSVAIPSSSILPTTFPTPSMSPVPRGELFYRVTYLSWTFQGPPSTSAATVVPSGSPSAG